MAKKAEPKDVSLGVCRFCQQEFAKGKMTQHLKTCKVRLSDMGEREGREQRLLHLFVEGKYRPEYWMHLEVPAELTLSDLDDFLRAIWLECCGHLSEFEIGGVSYSADMEDDWGLGFGGLKLVGNDGSEAEDEEDEGEDEDEEMPSMEEMATEMSKQLVAEFQTDLKNVPVEEIEKRLEQMFAENMPPGMSAATMPTLRPLLSLMASSLQQGTLAQDLEEAEEDEEEGGLDVELGDVLEVGEKFSYVYDFGSSSTLSLRVIAEREGVLPDDEEDDEGEKGEDEELEGDEDEDEDEDEEGEIALVVMARNEPPALKCHICGQPATRVPSASEYDSLAENALCDAHAKKAEYPDELLPVVNSPRVGICGYTGEGDEDWEEDEDEEDEEGEDEEDEDE